MEKLICRRGERCMRPQKGPHPRASGVKDPLGLSPNWWLVDTACPTQPPTARHGLPSRASCCQTGVSTCAMGKGTAGAGPSPAPTGALGSQAAPVGGRGAAGAHRSPCGPCGSSAAGPGAAASGGRRSPAGCCEGTQAASAWAGPQGGARLGLGHLHGHEGLVLLIEEAEVLWAAGLGVGGEQQCERPLLWAAAPSHELAGPGRHVLAPF